MYKKFLTSPFLLIFIFFFLFYLGFQAYFTKVFNYNTGDEPHYLVMVKSIVKDRDLNLDNNYIYENYKEFHEDPSLLPHYRDIKGKFYPHHQIGLPIILSLPYYIYGYKGVIIFLCFVGALTMALVFNLLTLFKIKNKLSLFITLLLGCSIPSLVYFSTQEFAEPFAAFLFILTLNIIYKYQHKNYPVYIYILLTLIATILGLMNTKFLLLMAGAGMADIFMNFKDRNKLFIRTAFWALAGIFTLGVYFILLHKVYDGEISLALKGFSAGEPLNYKLIPRNLYLLLFDGKQGLIWFAPFFLILMDIKGVFLIVKERFSLLFPLILASTPYLLGILAFFQALAGYCPPARYLVPILVTPAIIIGFYINKFGFTTLFKTLFILTIYATLVTLLSINILYPHPNLPPVLKSYFDTIKFYFVTAEGDFYYKTIEYVKILKGLFVVSPLLLIPNVNTILNLFTEDNKK